MGKSHRPIDHESSHPTGDTEKLSTVNKLILADVSMFLLGLCLAFGSAFAFDAPGSDKQIGTWVFAMSSLALPVLGLVCPFVAMVLEKLDLEKAAVWVLMVPFLDLAVFAVSVLWISVFQGGRFTG